MDYAKEIVGYAELHSPEGIKKCFSHGVSPNDLYEGKPLFEIMVNMYTRTSRFSDCIKVFVDHGLEYDDKVLLAILLNDADALNDFLKEDPNIISQKVTLQCAYTPVFEASLLHVCAEYNHLKCAEVLIRHGANVNDEAGLDENGFGGQTPIFHTVNQNNNNSLEMMEYLLSQSADLSKSVKGLIWGKGYSWETFIPAVNPISYAIMGLLPQMHRNETTISKIISRLIRHEYGIDYIPENVPCKYLLE